MSFECRCSRHVFVAVNNGFCHVGVIAGSIDFVVVVVAMTVSIPLVVVV